MTSPIIIQLRVVQGRPAGKCLKFARGDFYFGRGAECQVRPNSDWVSRQHCLLRVTPVGVTLRDLGSRNGTLLNGALLTGEQPLRHGDQIQIGPVVFEVGLEAGPAVGAPEAAPEEIAAEAGPAPLPTDQTAPQPPLQPQPQPHPKGSSEKSQ